MEQVRVKALLVDTSSNAPVVLLEGSATDKVMPIWIGQNEALAISLKLQDKDFERPLTHDLLKSVLQELNQNLERVVIDHLDNNTYYATLVISNKEGGEITEIDSRPSDSIALALRTGSPIFVDDEIFQQVAMESPFDEELEDDESSEEFQDFLDQQMEIRKFKEFTDDEEE
ncbi:MAG: bifunctional nuclease family protein [Candidatus Bipolaricaulota bacterium]